MTIPFTKMQGLGNDFVVIDAVQQAITITPALVKQMSDRHFGIGFDQLLLIEAAQQPGTDFSYRIFNADGQEVAQCGNGARCVGRYLWDSGLATQNAIVLGTKQRNLQVRLSPANQQVVVNMGVPVLAPENVPFTAPCQSDKYRLELTDEVVEIGVVNMGNPHAVLIVGDVDNAAVQTIGVQLQQHPFFPEQVNVGFMQCLDRAHVRLRVYERGAGETLACGSGACAAVVVGRIYGLLADRVQVDLPGGGLAVQWQGGNSAVWLEGPAETVFKGEWLK